MVVSSVVASADGVFTFTCKIRLAFGGSLAIRAASWIAQDA
jgi:hypothetical protein